jgi:hypothetical protein
LNKNIAEVGLTHEARPVTESRDYPVVLGFENIEIDGGFLM